MLPTSPIMTSSSSPRPSFTSTSTSSLSPSPLTPDSEVSDLFHHLRAVVTEWPSSSSPLPVGLFQFAVGNAIYILDFRSISNYDVLRQSKLLLSSPSQPIECTISTSPEDFLSLFGARPKSISSSLMAMVLAGRVGFQGNPRKVKPLRPLFIAARKRGMEMERGRRKGSAVPSSPFSLSSSASFLSSSSSSSPSSPFPSSSSSSYMNNILNPHYPLKFKSSSDPSWVPDNAVSSCHLCLEDFTLTRRRHHCKLCCLIFCYECSKYEVLKHRVCSTCFQLVQQRLEIMKAKKGDYEGIMGGNSVPSVSIISATEPTVVTTAVEVARRTMGSTVMVKRINNQNGNGKGSKKNSLSSREGSLILNGMLSNPGSATTSPILLPNNHPNHSHRTSTSSVSSKSSSLSLFPSSSSPTSSPPLRPSLSSSSTTSTRSRLVSNAVRPRSLLAEPLGNTIQSIGKERNSESDNGHVNGNGNGVMNGIAHLMGGGGNMTSPVMNGRSLYQTPPRSSLSLPSIPSSLLSPSFPPLPPPAFSTSSSSPSPSANLHSRANNWTLTAINDKLSQWESSKRRWTVYNILFILMMIVLSIGMSIIFTSYILSCVDGENHYMKKGGKEGIVGMVNATLPLLITSFHQCSSSLSSTLSSLYVSLPHYVRDSYSYICHYTMNVILPALPSPSFIINSVNNFDIHSLSYDNMVSFTHNIPQNLTQCASNVSYYFSNIQSLCLHYYTILSPILLHYSLLLSPPLTLLLNSLHQYRYPLLLSLLFLYSLLLYLYQWSVVSRRLRILMVAAYVIGRLEWQKGKDRWRGVDYSGGGKGNKNKMSKKKGMKDINGNVPSSLSPSDLLSLSIAEWDSLHSHLSLFLLHHIKSLRGFWVKVGQYLSSRSDIMPSPYIHHFSSLQDDCHPSPYSHIEKSFYSSFHRHIDDVFLSFNRVPLASASIAQVHEGILRDRDQQHVVIKVRHPHIAHLMPQDFSTLNIIMTIVSWIEKDYDFRPLIGEWNREMTKELNFVREADNMTKVRDHMNTLNIDVIIPRPITPYISSTVLMMEYIDGFKISNMDKLNEHHVDRYQIVTKIMQAIAAQIYYFGIFNGDPHSGNIMVAVNANTGKCTPVLLDFGLTKELTLPIKNAFCLMVASVADGDFASLLSSFHQMGLKLKRDNPIGDMKELQWALRDTSPADESREEVRKHMEERRRMGKKRPKTLRNPIESWPTELVFYMRTTFLLRGLCSLLQVKLPYLDILTPYAKLSIINSYPLSSHATHIIYPSPVLSSLDTKLRILLTRLYEEGDIIGCQVVVYHKSKKISDICCGVKGRIDPRPITPETLFNAFSLTKPVAATLLHMLIDNRIPYHSTVPHQQVDYHRKVSHYWPRFAAHQKEECTIAHLMSHQGGLENAVNGHTAIEDLCDWKRMVNMVALSKPTSPPPSTPTYHYLSYGYLVGGLLTEITGRSFPAILRDQLSLPLGIADEFFIGCPDHMHENIATLCNGFGADGGPPKMEEMKEMMEMMREKRRREKEERREKEKEKENKNNRIKKKGGMGNGSSNGRLESINENHSSSSSSSTSSSLRKHQSNGHRHRGVSFADQQEGNRNINGHQEDEEDNDEENDHDDDHSDASDDDDSSSSVTSSLLSPSPTGHLSLIDPLLFNLPQLRRACLPSANGHFSARALAKFLAALSNDGAIEGVRLLSSGKSTAIYTQVEAVSSVELPFGGGNSTIQWGKGVRVFDMKHPPTKAWGHSGLGGSMAFVHPGTQTAVVVLVNKLTLSRKVATQTLELVMKELNLVLDDGGLMGMGGMGGGSGMM